MDDQGFDFQSAERREPRQFEPPPWERDAFDDLQRQRAESPVTRGPEPTETGPAEEPAVVSVPETAGAEETTATTAEQAPAAKRAGEGPSEAEIIEYLAGLAEEEPDPRGPATVVTIASAIVLMPIGIVLVVWGVAALVKAEAAYANAGIARTGAATMVLFGAGFVAAAFWLIYRLMKQRGVL